MIPEAAVEAVYALLPDDALRHVNKARVKVMLEAAAPYMLAEAFDQGQKSGMRHADRLVAAAKIGRPELPGPISPNPYRPTP